MVELKGWFNKRMKKWRQPYLSKIIFYSGICYLYKLSLIFPYPPIILWKVAKHGWKFNYFDACRFSLYIAVFVIFCLRDLVSSVFISQNNYWKTYRKVLTNCPRYVIIAVDGVDRRGTNICSSSFFCDKQVFAKTVVRKRTREHLFAFIGAATRPAAL